MKIAKDKAVLIAFAATVVLLALTTYYGKDSRTEVFVSSIGALGQVWIAAMLYFLARDQFLHSKLVAKAQDRSENFERRVTLQQQFSNSCKEIGTTKMNGENIGEMKKCIVKIGYLFGEEAKAMASECHSIAVEANKKFNEITAAGDKTRGDTELQKLVEKFRSTQHTTYRLMAANTGVTVQESEVE